MNKLLSLVNKKSTSNEIASNNILVYSPFGQGKTTLKNKIKSNLENDNGYIVYDINIWEYEDLDIVDNILLTVMMETPEIFEDTDLLSNISELIITRSEKIQKLITILKGLSKKKYDDFVKEMDEKYYLNKMSQDIFNSISNRFKDKKIIFLFDELDRCTEEYIKLFFSKIKVIFKFDNFVNIFFANKDVLNNVFSSLNISGQEYFLEKFLAYEYRIGDDQLIFLSSIIMEYFPENFTTFYESMSRMNKNLELVFNKITFRELTKHEEDIKSFFEIIKSDKRIEQTIIYKNDFNWFWMMIILIVKNKTIQLYEAIEFIREILKYDKIDFPFMASNSDFSSYNPYCLERNGNILNPDPTIYNISLLIYNLDKMSGNNKSNRELSKLDKDFDDTMSKIFYINK